MFKSKDQKTLDQSSFKQEEQARFNLNERRDYLRELLVNQASSDMFSLSKVLEDVNTFSQLFGVDGSQKKLKNNVGLLNRGFVSGCVTGGRTNLNKQKDLVTLDLFESDSRNNLNELIKLSMRDCEYDISYDFSIRNSDYFNSQSFTLIDDGSFKQLLWDVAKMVHFDKQYSTLENPEIIKSRIKLAQNGRIKSFPKDISNQGSMVHAMLEEEIEFLDMISQKEIFSVLLNPEEIFVQNHEGSLAVEQFRNSGFNNKLLTSKTSIDPLIAQLMQDYAELLENQLTTVFFKSSDNPHAVKVEFLNSINIKDLDFLKALDIEMRGITAVPLPIFQADNLSRNVINIAHSVLNAQEALGKKSLQERVFTRPIKFRD